MTLVYFKTTRTDPVEHVLATNAATVAIDTQGIGIHWNDRLR